MTPVRCEWQSPQAWAATISCWTLEPDPDVIFRLLDLAAIPDPVCAMLNSLSPADLLEPFTVRSGRVMRWIHAGDGLWSRPGIIGQVS
jgi:hypothetical protein